MFDATSLKFSAGHPMFSYEVPPSDPNLKTWLKTYARFVVVGMGGSILPLKSLTDALELSDRIQFLDTVEEKVLERTLAHPAKTLYCVASKSGETFEIKFLLSALLARGQEENLLIATDPKKGFLRDLAQKRGWKSCEIPGAIGGRFTHFTPLHRLLLERFGINFDHMLRTAREHCESLQKNPEVVRELARQTFGGSVARQLILLSYGQKWRGLAEWIQQGMAESLGKMTKQGTRVGILPTTLMGPQDQHSVLQLLMEGPQVNTLWFFRDAEVASPKRAKAADLKTPELQPYAQLNSTEAMHILAEATFRSFAERLESAETAQPVVDFAMKDAAMDVVRTIVTICAVIESVGEILKINPFDQPGVERGKQITRELLALKA